MGQLRAADTTAEDRGFRRVSMSQYIRILNSLKQQVPRLPLTPSQRSCRHRIEDRLAHAGTVNLYGGSGVGKTVLGWSMASGAQVTYLPCSRELALLSPALGPREILVVDNAASDRMSHRRLLGTLEAAGVDRAVVVTRSPVDDYCFRLELTLTSADIDIVRANLGAIGYPVREQSAQSLWKLLLEAAGVYDEP